jgi:hypothetical protein
MLDQLTAHLLFTPARVLLAALVAALAGAVVGWLGVGGKVAAAWTKVAEHETSGRQHAYRDPLRTASILKPALLVRAAAITGYALWAAHASWFVVFVEEARLARAGGAALALGLFGIGVGMAYGAHVLATGGPAASPKARRRAVVAGILGLGAHGAMVSFLAAVMAGRFDTLEVEVRGIKGLTSMMSLGEIREMLPRHPNLLSAGGHLLPTWYALAVWAFAHSLASLLHATLLLALVRATHDPSAAATLDGAAGQAPRLPWFRRRWWLFPSGGALLAILGGGLLLTRCVPALTAKLVYAQVKPVCSLPELPAGASDLRGKHDVELMSEDAFIQLRTPDPASYAAHLAGAGYMEIKPAERGGLVTAPGWGLDDVPRSVEHHRFSRQHEREPGVIDAMTVCDVHVDRADGLVRIWMWAGD